MKSFLLFLALFCATTTLTHLQAQTWTVQASGSSINDVWMFNSTTGWAVGSAGAIFYTSDGGTTWTAQSSGTIEALTSVWGADATHVWAVGNTGTVLFYNGSTWTTQASMTTNILNGIWGSDVTHVWSVGQSGTILFYDGSTWAAQTSGTTHTLTGVWGSDATHVWISGAYDSGTSSAVILSTSNGGINWARQTNTSLALLNDIWGTDANNLWAVGASGNIQVTTNGGTSWAAQTSGTTQELRRVSGINASNVWAVGNSGTILKYDGTNWAAQTSGSVRGIFGLSTVDGSNIWASGDAGTILKYNGTSWSTQRSKTPSATLNAIWGSDANNIWAVGNAISLVGTIFRYNGAEWTTQNANTTGNLNGIWGANTSNIWAVGSTGTILKYNGSIWAAQMSGTTFNLNSIWGTDAINLWAVGNSGTICSTTDGGLNWSVTTSGTQTLVGIWGTDASNIWAVGNGGTILKYNGISWSAQTSNATVLLRGIWGTDANNLWVVGSSGNVCSTTNGGTTWTQQSLGTQTFRSVYGHNASNIWAVGVSSVIYKYNGTTWSAQTSPVSGLTLAGVISIGTRQWIAGSLGNILTSSDNVLPIELLRFDGKNTEGGNLLSWTTANEVNNKGFQVERAPQPPTGAFDAWDILGFVNAKGKAATYEFLDATSTSGAGAAYYRLRQFDNDGKETLSKIISIQNTPSGGRGLKVYPNPVSNTLTVENTVTQSVMAQDALKGGDYQILNVLGQQVLTGKTPPLGAGGLDVSVLPEGTYFLKVGVEQVKFIKQ